MILSFVRVTAGYIFHILCGKSIVVNFGIWNVEGFSYVIAFGHVFHVSQIRQLLT